MWTIGQEEKRKLKEVVAFFRGFRIFANLRSNTIEKVVKYMEVVDFKRGQKVYREGVNKIDGLYFITQGDFEVTQSIDNSQIKGDHKIAQKALSRYTGGKASQSKPDLHASLSRGSRSQMLLQKIAKGQRGNLSSRAELNTIKDVKVLRLVILGKNELFGLEEIMEN